MYPDEGFFVSTRCRTRSKLVVTEPECTVGDNGPCGMFFRLGELATRNLEPLFTAKVKRLGKLGR